MTSSDPSSADAPSAGAERTRVGRLGTRSLVTPIACHAAFNLVAMVAIAAETLS